MQLRVEKEQEEQKEEEVEGVKVHRCAGYVDYQDGRMQLAKKLHRWLDTTSSVCRLCCVHLSCTVEHELARSFFSCAILMALHVELAICASRRACLHARTNSGQ